MDLIVIEFNFGFTVEVKDADSLVMSIPNDEIEEFRWVDFNQVTAMSGGKASYANFQSILLGEMSSPSYVEIKV